jgi:hypothetical protein
MDHSNEHPPALGAVHRGSLLRPGRRAREGGASAVVVLTVVVLIASLSSALLMRSMGGQRAADANAMALRLLAAAEGGLDWIDVQLLDDPLAPARDVAGFSVVSQIYQSPWITLDSAATTKPQRFRVGVEYRYRGATVEFADRARPVELFDEVRVTSTAAVGTLQRAILRTYSLETLVRGAIVSDMIPAAPPSGAPKPAAKLGHVHLSAQGFGPVIAVYGDIWANGEVNWYPDTSSFVELKTTNAASFMLGHQGQIHANLGGTADELPDFTGLTSADQLFDFDRFEAAAAAGAGRVFADVNEFLTAIAAANGGTGPALEGIIVVHVEDPVPTTPPWPAGGITVRGTLVFRFEPTVDPLEIIRIETPLRINPANLATVSLSDPGTFTTGYPPTYTTAVPKPWEVDISGAGFQNFGPNDDYPALMYDRAIVDLHDEVNICGVIYTPSFVEIENLFGAAGTTMYVNGAVYAGHGVLLDVWEGTRRVAIKYDLATVDALPYARGGLALKRASFAILPR